MPDSSDYEDTGPPDPPSKSARKRQMLGLQAMGESLLGLTDRQLAQIPIDDDQLLAALRECRQINSNSARKRQLQFIGKLMRNIDPAPIEQALLTLHTLQQQNTAAFHLLEQLRDDMLAGGANAVELAMARFPAADRQHLRQLVLQHQREAKDHKPPAASRKLFRYLKELLDARGEPD